MPITLTITIKDGDADCVLIRCDHHRQGCSAWLGIDDYQSHCLNCDKNPKQSDKEDPTADVFVEQDVAELGKDLKDSSKQIDELRAKLEIQERKCDEFNRNRDQFRVDLMCHAMTRMDIMGRLPAPMDRATAERIDRTCLMEWGRTLPLATIDNWDKCLNMSIKYMRSVVPEALVDNKCPEQLKNLVLTGCEESKWPVGLNSQEARQSNMPRLPRIVARLLPLKSIRMPLVIILSGDNEHMPDYLCPRMSAVMFFLDSVEMQRSEVSSVDVASLASSTNSEASTSSSSLNSSISDEIFERGRPMDSFLIHGTYVETITISDDESETDESDSEESTISILLGNHRNHHMS